VNGREDGSMTPGGSRAPAGRRWAWLRTPRQHRYFAATASIGLALAVLLYLVSRANYPLFHSIVDAVTVFIAGSVFLVVWNGRRLLDNHYYLFIAIAFLAFALLDFMHLIGNKGMGVFPQYGSLGPTFYIASRYVLGVSFLLAPLFIKRKVSTVAVFALYLLMVLLVLLSVLHWRNFPATFVEGTGLTAFKVYSDYAVCLLLLGGLGLLLLNRREFDARVLKLISFSLFLSIASGLAFTLYSDPFGIANAVGHFFQIASFGLIYLGFVETAFTKPQSIVFRNLKQSNENVLRLNAELEYVTLSLSRDIAARKETEEALRVSEETFAKMFQVTTVALALTRVEDGRVLDVNDQWLELMEYRREDVVGRCAAEYGGWKSLDDRAAILREVQDRGFVRDREVVVRPRSGREWTVLFSAQPIAIRGEQLLLTSAVDITARKQAEAALRKSEEEFKSMTETSPLAIFASSGLDETASYINPTFVRLFGYTIEDVPSATVWWPLAYPDETYRNQIGEEWRRRIESAIKTHSTIEPMEVVVTCKDGSKKNISWGFVSTPTQNYSFGLDLTARKQAEAALQQVNADLLAANKQLATSRASALNLMEDADLARQQAERAAAALRESEQRIQQALLVSRSFTFEWDPATDQVRRSASCRTILGLTGGEAVNDTGQNYFQRVHTDDRARFVQMLGALTPAAGDYKTEYRAKCPGEREVVLEEIGQGEFDAAGRLTRLVGVTTDITERKRAEEALHESDERLRVATESARVGMWAADISSGTWDFAPQAARVFGLPHDGPVSIERILELTHPDDRERLSEQSALALAGAGEHEFEYRIIRPDGELRWVVLRGRTDLDAEGRPWRNMGVVMDITARKAVEAERTRLSDELAERVTELQALLETAPVAVWIAQDSQCRKITGNAYADRLMQAPHGGNVSRSAGDAVVAYKVFREGVELAPEAMPAQAAIATGKPVAATVLDLAFADGRVVQLMEAAVPLFDSRGQVRGAIATGVDVTALSQAERQIRSSLREKEVLLKEVHHRVKNNMQVLASLVSLQADGLDDPATRAVFDEFRDQVRTMALVHESLYQSETLANIDFAYFASALTAGLARTHGRGNSDIRLRLDVEPVSLPIESAVPCGLILNELVTNAYKHAFRDRSSGEIVVRLRTDSAGRVRLGVIDNGVGLAAGVDWRQSPSLGLRLVQMLARQVRAELDLRTENGTAFQLTFTPSMHKESKGDAHA
jgi:PAS domain S-box-containing protein